MVAVTATDRKKEKIPQNFCFLMKVDDMMFTSPEVRVSLVSLGASDVLLLAIDSKG